MNPAKWDNGTADLTLEQEAAYLRIVNAINKGDEPCPANSHVLAGLFRCNTQRAKRLLSDLIHAGKVWVEDGKIYNEHAMSDVRVRCGLRVTRQRVGKLGGTQKHLNTSKPLETNKPELPIATPREEKKRRREDSCAFSGFWAAFPSGRKVGKKKCISVFNAAVRSGVSPEHIIEAVKKYAAHVEKRRTEDRYIKNSTTWLNQGCWDDELETGREDSALDNQGIRKIENGMGDSERGGDRGEAPPRDTEDDMPGMQSDPAEEIRSVPVGDVQAGRDRLEMLALSDGGRIVF